MPELTLIYCSLVELTSEAHYNLREGPFFPPLSIDLCIVGAGPDQRPGLRLGLPCAAQEQEHRDLLKQM